MTTEPRQEAERIVGDLGYAIQARSAASTIDEATATDDVMVYRRERLVDALAAAIDAVNVTEWEPFIHADGTQRVPVGHYQIAELYRALSALREDET